MMVARMKTVLAALVVFLTLAATGAAAAQGSPTPRLLAAGEVLRGRFVQERFLQGFEKPLRSEGSYVLDLGQGLLWRTEAPFAVTTSLSAAGIVQEVRGAETMRLSADRVPLLAGLYSVLSGALGGDVARLGQLFQARRGEADGAWRVVLSPNETAARSMPIAEIVLTGRSLVENVEIRRANGDRDHIQFVDQEISSRPLGSDEARLILSPARP